MAEARFRGMILFGTDEPVPPPIILRAGPLTAELEDGNLRYIRLHGHEMIRAVSYLVRDRNWGTYRPEIRDLSVESNEAQFIVRYLGQVADAEQSLTYRARIEGRPDGSLSFAVDAESPVDFVTNRAGFVVLHPVDGVAGEPVMVEDADGRRYGARFPDLIDPMQPFKNLRALTHEFARDHKVTCRMEGDVFEMEDQRNWLDASFKTYVRPLERPWPYVLEKGRPFSQAVHLSVDVASGARLDPPQTDATIAMARAMALPGGATQLVPVLGFGLEARHTEATRTVRRLLQEAQPHHVVCLHYPGASRDEDSATAASLEDQLQAAHDIAPHVWLEAVVTSVDDYANELSSLARTVSHVGKPVATLLVSPEADLKSTTPGGIWPPAPPLADLYAKAREAFLGVRIGGGMFSYFTELNRKRPPVEELDLVTFTTCSIVHACDDRSVTEGLEVLPSMLRSARAFIGSTPLHVGPSAIGMRMNPYGTAPTENPNGIRRAMARNDPRQKGLLGAAWALAYVAHMAREGVEAVTLGGGVGDFGLLRGRSADSTAAHGDDELILNPVFHVFRGLARLAGAPLLGLTMSPQRSLQAIGACVGETSEIWVANLTGDELAVQLWEDISGRIAILDEGTFEAAESDPRYMDQGTPFRGHILSLRPYAVARLEMDPGNR